MMRRFTLVASFLLLICMTSALAENAGFRPLPLPASQSNEKLSTTTQSSRSTTHTRISTTQRQLEEELETLEAQRQTRKGHLKIAELGVTEAEQDLEEATREKDIQEARQELDLAKARLEVKAGELREVEVKIKFVKKRLEEHKTVLMLKETARELEASGGMMGPIGLGGIPFFAFLAHLQLPEAAPSGGGSKIAVFNMAAVMRDFGKAKFKVWELNEEKKKMTAELINMKERVQKLAQEIPVERDPMKKDELLTEQRNLAREYEDMDREITKKLNDKASAIIGGLYDNIKMVADKFSESRGYDIIFAYPDAVTPEEAKTAYVKELKLKPPAAQPFVMGRHVDITSEIVEELNTQFPAPPIPHQSPLPYVRPQPLRNGQGFPGQK
jgi:Skp family chaperone for outer membrane proteins